MVLTAVPLIEEFVPFLDHVFRQNIEVLHGGEISVDEWRRYLVGEDADPHEVNFVITADGENAAWLKIHSMNKSIICISMLVVDDKYKRMGVGSFAVGFAEDFARGNKKTGVRIQTTADNVAATRCYLKCGYKIVREMKYVVGDGVMRDGYEFLKET